MIFNLGTSGRNHIVTTVEDALLSRYGFRFNRQENTTEDIRFETLWKEIPIMSDETSAGYTDIRLRIMVNARPRSRATGTASTYSTRMEVECEATLTVGGNYQPVPITPEREEYIQEIADYLENEFKAEVM